MARLGQLNDATVRVVLGQVVDVLHARNIFEQHDFSQLDFVQMFQEFEGSLGISLSRFGKCGRQLVGQEDKLFFL